MNIIKLDLPLDAEKISSLKVGDKVLLSGVIYTARDQAHRRMVDLIEQGESLPIVPRETCIFYCGPSPTPPGKICGAIGPTTSARMDKASLILLDHGFRVMIGKGERSPELVQKIKDKSGVYFVCTGGIAALLSKFVVSCETLAWSDLGAEAIYKLMVKDFPVYVAIV